MVFAAVAVNATEDDPYHYTLIKKEGPGWDLKALPAPAHPHPYYWGWYGRKKRSAEADPQLLYHHGLPHVLPAAHVLPVAHPVARTAAVTAVEHTPAEVTHTVTPVVAHYAHPYGYGLWGRKKREAEADADASPYYYGYYGAGYPYYGYGYAHHGYYGIHPSHYGICHNNLGARVPC